MKDNYLHKTNTDKDVFIEFAAVFLELHFFAPQLLAVYFPGLDEDKRRAILRMMDNDIQAKVLFGRTRPEGAPRTATGKT